MASIHENRAVAVLCLIFASFQLSTGAVYKVGDSAGWTTIGNVNYKQWAITKTFQVGDIIGIYTIVFSSSHPSLHEVVLSYVALVLVLEFYDVSQFHITMLLFLVYTENDSLFSYVSKSNEHFLLLTTCTYMQLARKISPTLEDGILFCSFFCFM